MPKINVNNTDLFFDVYGSELEVLKTSVSKKPTLLVLHGGHGFADHTLYVEFWSQFSDIAQVIFLDQRGCGRSDADIKENWNLRQWADDVKSFCDSLSIQKPIIVGVSMGGHVICDYVTRYPDHPGGLIFCNTEAKFDVDLVVAKFTELGGEEVGKIARLNFSAQTPEILQKFTQCCIPYYAKNAYSTVELNRCIQRREVFEHYCKNEMNQFDYHEKLNLIQCPVLFMVGEASPGHPPKAAEAMSQRINKNRVTYHLFKEAGAPTYKDAPKEAYQVVRDFVFNSMHAC